MLSSESVQKKKVKGRWRGWAQQWHDTLLLWRRSGHSMIPGVIRQSFNFTLCWEYEQRPGVMSHSIGKKKKKPQDFCAWLAKRKKKPRTNSLSLVEKKSKNNIFSRKALEALSPVEGAVTWKYSMFCHHWFTTMYNKYKKYMQLAMIQYFSCHLKLDSSRSRNST